MVLVGNKVDLEEERTVAQEEGAELAKTFSCSFIEASAKLRTNVDEIFQDIVRQINRTGTRGFLPGQTLFMRGVAILRCSLMRSVWFRCWWTGLPNLGDAFGLGVRRLQPQGG